MRVTNLGTQRPALRSVAATALAGLLLLPVLRAPLPGDVLYRLRRDRTLRDLPGLWHRLRHGAEDLVGADLPRTLHRPLADLSDWLAWQWFGLEPELYRAALSIAPMVTTSSKSSKQ